MIFNKIRLYLVMILLCAVLAPVAAYAAGRNVVYLKNGSEIHGEIVEQIPDQSIKIKTSDGNIFVFPMGDVDRITWEETPPTDETWAHPPEDPDLAEDMRATGEDIHSNARRYRNPGSAVAWSLVVGFFTPVHGAGQFYNGQVGKGLAFTGLALVDSTVMYVGIGLESPGITLIGASAVLANWILSAVDAYRSAEKINRAKGYFASQHELRFGLAVLGGASSGRPGEAWAASAGIPPLGVSPPGLARDFGPSPQTTVMTVGMSF